MRFGNMARKFRPGIHIYSLAMLIPLIILALCGCNSILPAPEPIHVLVPASNNYEAVMALEVALVTTDTEVGPTPNKLKEGDKCTNCSGTGKITQDGVPTGDCWMCLGDGIANKNDPILTNPGEYVITIFGEMVDGINESLKQPIPGKKENPECTCIDCKCVNCTCKKPEACKPIPKEVGSGEPDDPAECCIHGRFHDCPDCKMQNGVVIDPPISPRKPQVVKKYEAKTNYHMYWNMRHYTWSDAQNCFIDQLGHIVTFASIPGFHPSKYPQVQMGCSTGRCTLVPITKSVSQVEVTDDQPRATQRVKDGASKK
jgi:hypothetical protein